LGSTDHGTGNDGWAGDRKPGLLRFGRDETGREIVPPSLARHLYSINTIFWKRGQNQWGKLSGQKLNRIIQLQGRDIGETKKN